MMYCTKCGKQNEDNARFCAFCGAPLKQGGNTENTEPADGQGNVRKTKEKKNRSKAGKILLILLPVLVVLAAAAVTVIVFYYNPDRERRSTRQKLQTGTDIWKNWTTRRRRPATCLPLTWSRRKKSLI